MKKIKYVLLVLVSLLAVSPVYAEETLTSVQQDKYDINDTYYKAETNVSEDKSVDGSSVLLGDKVEFNGSIEGVLISGGNNLTIKGQSEYGLIAGNNVIVSGKYTKEAAIMGATITVENAEFGRDVYIAGSQVTLSGKVSRNLTIYAQKVVIENATILGDVKIDAPEIEVKNTTKIEGTLKYSISDKTNIEKNDNISKIETFEVNRENNIAHNIKNKIFNYAGLLLVFAVLVLALPKLVAKIKHSKFDAGEIFNLCGKGVIVLILVPILSVLLFTLVIGVPLALITIVLYFIILYLSKAFFGYYVGHEIWTKYIKKEENALLEGFVGIGLIFILSLIPVLNVFVEVVALLAGIGLVYNLFKK